MSGPAIGRLLAYLMLGAVGVLMIVALVVNLNTAPAPTAAPPPPPTVDLDGLTAPPIGLEDGDATAILDEVSGIRLEGVDDGELRYEIEADRLDPEGEGRMRLEKPDATIYLDGYIVRVKAERGSIVKRGDGPLERGRLEGGVEAELLTVPEMTSVGILRTERVRFEATLGELEAPGDIAIDGEGIWFRGTNVIVRLSEFRKGRYGLSYLKIASAEGLRLLPSALDRRSPSGRDADDEGSGDGGAASADEGFMQYLVAAVGNGVEIRQGGRFARGDRLEAIGVFVDGALAPGAIQPIRFEEQPDADPGPRDRRRSDEEQAAAALDEWIEASWGGAMEIRALGAAPAGLAEGELATVLLESRGATIEARDEGAGLLASAASVRYSATTGRFSMVGAQPDSGVDLSAASVGQIRCGRLDVSLGASPAIRGEIPGAGELRSTQRDAGVRWARGATFEGALERRDGRTGVRPLGAEARGSVEAWNDDKRVNAETAVVETRRTRAGMDELDRVELDGGIRAIAGEEEAELEAEWALIEFEADGAPSRAEVTGGVRAMQKGRTLESERAVVEFETDVLGETLAERVEATGGVAIITEDGLRVVSTTANADVQNEIVELQGEGTEAVREVGGRTYLLGAASMRVEMAEGKLTVFGPGWTEYRNGPEHGRLSWEGGMVYDDLRGEAEAIGRVIGERSAGGMERQAIEAEEARVRVTPEGRGGERTLLSVVAIGREGDPATVEGRWYREGDTGLERSRLIALRSERIEVDSVDETLRAPHAGVLVVDESPGGTVAGGSSMVEGFGSSAGTTGVWWDGELEMSRAEGWATMSDGVRITHAPIDGSGEDPVEMDCERLRAEFTPGSDRPELRTVEAAGAVYVARGGSEVVCDEVRYEADTARLIGIAAPGNLVTLLDGSTGRHVTAAEVELDITTGDWKARRARVTPQPR